MEILVELVPEPDLVRESIAEPWSRRSWRDAQWAGVAIDVLRATTSLTVAMAHGARGIEPFATTEAALQRRAAGPDVLACGERNGRIVHGFDLGNSPAEFTRERVAGKTLAFASTNGSLAMRSLAGCGRRWLGAFVNASAVARALERERFVWLTCAGKEGRFAAEDAACAGWLCAALEARGATLGNPAARLVRALAPAGADAVRAAVEGAEHGRTLRAMGPEYAADVAFCASLDKIDQAYAF